MIGMHWYWVDELYKAHLVILMDNLYTLPTLHFFGYFVVKTNQFQ